MWVSMEKVNVRIYRLWIPKKLREDSKDSNTLNVFFYLSSINTYVYIDIIQKRKSIMFLLPRDSGMYGIT